jgi:hypothetical protein
MPNLRPAALAMLVVLLLAPLAVFFTSTGAASAWCGAWTLLFCWFLFSKQDHASRGLWLIVGTVAIAVIGKVLLKQYIPQDILEALSQMFMLVGGGVGGNFLSSGIQKSEAVAKKG